MSLKSTSYRHPIREEAIYPSTPPGRVGLAVLLIFSLHIIFNFTCDEVLWQTRTKWNEVESDGFFTTGMTTQQTAPWENWHLERGFKLLGTFGLVRWGLGGSGHVEGTGEKLSFASQAAR
ncbi:hypothetical protein TNCT_622121 [Trichonephila clavata]|uniref:Uncharacterized protein n=1 Tax=Trichonephila clavata TaxID=2740835 RepID=A0A8X6KTE8_TRICU|nr:hypothetical protein TNCT_622121 [Trichonephila clavata]